MAKRSAKRVGSSNTLAKPAFRVFLSHATADKWIATRICEAIDSLGVTTFRDDRDIEGGGDIPERIRLELSQAHELVVFITPNSANRPWVLIEVGAYWMANPNGRIVPVLYCVKADSIPELIKNHRAIDLNFDFEQYLHELRVRAT